MKGFWVRVWNETLNTLLPHPEGVSPEDRAARDESTQAEIRQIREITGSENTAALLETARVVLAEEDGRKTGAEARATTFLAAVAALIPIMTWAVGTASPVCSPGLGCAAWSAVFILALIYLMAAGFWSLRTSAVDNYHCLGVEEVREFASAGEFELSVAKETLINARLNRDTINRKLAFIKCAQRSFYQAMFLLVVLLMCDPLARYKVLSGHTATVDKSTGSAADVEKLPIAASPSQPVIAEPASIVAAPEPPPVTASKAPPESLSAPSAEPKSGSSDEQ